MSGDEPKPFKGMGKEQVLSWTHDVKGIPVCSTCSLLVLSSGRGLSSKSCSYHIFSTIVHATIFQQLNFRLWGERCILYAKKYYCISSEHGNHLLRAGWRGKIRKWNQKTLFISFFFAMVVPRAEIDQCWRLFLSRRTGRYKQDKCCCKGNWLWEYSQPWPWEHTVYVIVIAFSEYVRLN